MKKFQVLIRLRGSILDVQGKAVEHGLAAVGMTKVRDVRVGKLVEFDIDAATKEEALETIEHLCKTVLVNPVMESFEVREVA